MEGLTSNWSLEHVLRNLSIESKVVKKLIQTISLSDDETDYSPKIAIILRTLEDELLLRASIPEWMLELLEVLEKLLLLHYCGSNPITNAMKSAYCAIAVECTLKYLELKTTPNPSYSKAVDRIWRVRVGNMEEEEEEEPSSSSAGETSFLLSHHLKIWNTQIQASLLDSGVMEKLSSIPNNRREAIQKLKLFLEETWQNLAPSFLESLAHEEEEEENQLGVGVTVTVSDSHVNEKDKESPIEVEKYNDMLRGNSTTVAEELATSTSCSKINSLPISEVPMNGEYRKCNSVELETLAKDPMPDIVRSDLAIEDTNHEPQMGNQSTYANVPNPQLCQRMNDNEVNLNKTNSRPSDVRHHPSWMNPNSSARTHEWDDFIDGLQGETSRSTRRIRLRTPNWKKISPLKEYEPKPIRKRRRKWSKLEEENLRTGVKVIGEGKWKLIRRSYTFDKRTEVDLKDKWRNLTQYGNQ
uniref:MYB family transcription factor n=1 Tax=Melilotus albus TaxID=47082 RepID=A0A896WD04_MELAB|nr:MYB family transcription factor [Melilotus albus]